MNTGMKKGWAVVTLSLALLLSSCGNPGQAKLLEYRASMEEFFGKVSEIGDRMDAIDTEAEDYKAQLLTQLSRLQEAFDEMAKAEVPEEFSTLDDLPEEAADNLKNACALYRQVLESPEYDPLVADAAEQYYDRANLRIQYIIMILHGEKPEGEGITYTTDEEEAE